MSSITLPFNYTPRPYQIPLFQALDSGYKRAVCLWHRRSGKDKSLINLMAKKMYERVGAYYYFLPTYSQGRKIIWEGMDKDGFRFLDHIPRPLRDGEPNNTEMKIEMKNGSVFRVIGTDRIDSIVGTNPIGCIFSEYSLQDPKAWNFIRPILAENGGWAVFNFTPRGHNHGFDIFQMAQQDPNNWFSQKLTVEDTGVISKEVLANEQREMMRQTGSDAHYLQEYYCSFEAPVIGAYYGNQLLEAEKENRITSVPYERELPVNTAWDLGVGDSTAIWFFQEAGREIRFIDYYETSGEGLVHYAKVLSERGYLYGYHIAPHDIEVKELGTGKTRLETARGYGLNFRTAPKLTLEDGIEAGRNIFNRCYFDKVKCERGINALKSYHKEFDDDAKTYKNHPEHDWSSHGADAFRYLAVSIKRPGVNNYTVAPRFQPNDRVIGI